MKMYYFEEKEPEPVCLDGIILEMRVPNNDITKTKGTEFYCVKHTGYKDCYYLRLKDNKQYCGYERK